MVKDRFTETGFTIIELVVTISVIGILLGMSYSQYATFTQRQKLITAGQTLKNILRDVESRSFNGEIDCSVCNCTDPNKESFVRWYMDLDNNIRQFYGSCGSNTFGVTNLGIVPEIFISSNFTLIEFYAAPPSVNEDINICLSLNGLENKYYRIELHKSGEISDSGGVIPVCSP